MEYLPYNQNLRDRARELRKNSTYSEVLLWNYLKDGAMFGYYFLRQRPIGNYIVDFYCKKLMLAIEADGSVHDSQKSQDAFRQGELESWGITFIRFSDAEVKSDIQEVLKKIKQVMATTKGFSP